MTNIVRYPQLSDPNLPQDLKDTYSELIRTLEVRDSEPVTPAEVYGRTVEYGGVSLTGLNYLGFTNVGTPTADNWHVYEVQIPRDVGTVVVVNPDTSPRTQVRVFLPKASLVSGRTITVLMDNRTGVNPFNTSINAIPGDSFVLYPIPNPSITGSLTITTNFAPASGQPPGLPLYALITNGSLGGGIPIGNKLVPLGAYDAGTGNWYGPVSDLFNSSSSLSLNVTTNQPPNWTFRAYGDIWYQIP